MYAKPCVQAYEIALSGIDLIDGRLPQSPDDYQLVVGRFTHFAEHNCVFGISLLINLNYMVRVSSNPTVLTRVATMIYYIIPDFWHKSNCGGSTDVYDWIVVFSERRKKTPEHTERFRLRITGMVDEYLKTAAIVTSCSRRQGQKCKCNGGPRVVVPPVAPTTNIHSMD